MAFEFPIQRLDQLAPRLSAVKDTLQYRIGDLQQQNPGWFHFSGERLLSDVLSLGAGYLASKAINRVMARDSEHFPHLVRGTQAGLVALGLGSMVVNAVKPGFLKEYYELTDQIMMGSLAFSTHTMMEMLGVNKIIYQEAFLPLLRNGINRIRGSKKTK
ncbi:MAG: hypothetical protein WCP97_07400 [bacterium]